MLRDIASCLQEHGTMTATELARRVDADVDAVRGMLEVWARKGKVVRSQPACGGCTSCDTAQTELYSWNGSQRVALTLGAPRADGCTVTAPSQ